MSDNKFRSGEPRQHEQGWDTTNRNRSYEQARNRNSYTPENEEQYQGSQPKLRQTGNFNEEQYDNYDTGSAYGPGYRNEWIEQNRAAYEPQEWQGRRGYERNIPNVYGRQYSSQQPYGNDQYGGRYQGPGNTGNQQYSGNQQYGGSYNPQHNSPTEHNRWQAGNYQGSQEWGTGRYTPNTGNESTYNHDSSMMINERGSLYSSGPHKGKGPKGYQRSDDRIKEDVSDRLMDDSHLDASDIEVDVENNEVILSGSVYNREAKRRAEELVESIPGVNNVENRLHVGRDYERRTTGNMQSNDQKNKKSSLANATS